MGIRDHRKLEVFQLADELVLQVCRGSERFPRSEMLGLVSQLRRCSVSVAANIIEGCGRRTSRQFDHFLDVAFGSLRELGYLIDLAHRLELLSDDQATTLQEAHGRSAAAFASFISSRKGL